MNLDQAISIQPVTSWNFQRRFTIRSRQDRWHVWKTVIVWEPMLNHLLVTGGIYSLSRTSHNIPLPSFQSPGSGGILNYEDSTTWTSDIVGELWLPGQFICSGNNDDFSGEVGACSLNLAFKHASNWIVTSAEYEIEYCLSEIVDQVCRVQLLLPIMAIVIVCNLVKLLCVASTIFMFREPPLVVFDDALASFLKNRGHSPRDKKPAKAEKRARRWEHVARLDVGLTLIL